MPCCVDCQPIGPDAANRVPAHSHVDACVQHGFRIGARYQQHVVADLLQVNHSMGDPWAEPLQDYRFLLRPDIINRPER
jgi:hypothetical protein